MSNNDITKEEDDVSAFCFDCCSEIPDHVAERDIFLQAGKTGVCPYCKGPMGVVYRHQIPGLRARRQRGEPLA